MAQRAASIDSSRPTSSLGPERTLTLTRRDGYWLATVPDPASGYVSLRSVVTDMNGESSVQTIYRAFAVAG